MESLVVGGVVVFHLYYMLGFRVPLVRMFTNFSLVMAQPQSWFRP